MCGGNRLSVVIKLADGMKANCKNLRALTGNDIEQQIRTALDDMDAIIASPRPDRRFLEALIDKIVIHSDRTVEFVLKTKIIV